jgi:hypothetical protein
MPLIPPTKIILSGNKSAASGLIKFATAQLSILERLMSFQNLNEGRRVVSPFNGVTVECTNKFGRKEVRVHVAEVSITHIPPVTKQITTEQEEKPPVKVIEDVGLYFVRIKYADPDINDYEVFSNVTYPSLDRDRIILWEIDLRFRGRPVLYLDVDVVRGTVYFPIDLTAEENAETLATASEYLTRCPSQVIPEPADSLKDWAVDWFASGGLSDPVQDSVVCDFLWPSVATDYTIDSTYLCADDVTEFSPLTPDAPGSWIDNYYLLQTWIDDWCPYPLANYEGQTWTGITGASDILGGLVSPYTGVDYHLAEVDPTWDVDYERWTGFMWIRSGSEITTSQKYLTNGTWFTNSASTGFNCFFVYDYMVSNDTNNLQHVGELFPCTEGTQGCYGGWAMGQLHAQFQFNSQKTLGGLVTPLEVIESVDFINSTYGTSCSEAPCKFATLKGEFLCSYEGFDSAIYNDYFTFPCDPVEGTGEVGGIGDNTKCSRSVGDSVRRFRNRVHISTVPLQDGADVNLVSLSHYREARAVEQVTMGGGAIPLHCDGVAGAKAGKLAEFGYVAYIFFPSALAWLNPDTQETEYWNIYSERVNPGFINPNRCLALEEYVNTVVGSIQIDLDSNVDITKMDAATSCSYPLNYYGYGITDGFIKK